MRLIWPVRQMRGLGCTNRDAMATRNAHAALRSRLAARLRSGDQRGMTRPTGETLAEASPQHLIRVVRSKVTPLWSTAMAMRQWQSTAQTATAPRLSSGRNELCRVQRGQDLTIHRVNMTLGASEERVSWTMGAYWRRETPKADPASHAKALRSTASWVAAQVSMPGFVRRRTALHLAYGTRRGCSTSASGLTLLMLAHGSSLRVYKVC